MIHVSVLENWQMWWTMTIPPSCDICIQWARLKKSGVWVPHALSQNHKNQRVTICASLLARHRLAREQHRPFLCFIITGGGKWYIYANIKRKDHLFGIVVSTSDCHPRGPGFDSRLYPKNFSGSIGSGTGFTQPRWVATWMRSSEIRLRKLKLRLRDKRIANHKAPCTVVWQQPLQLVLSLRDCSATDFLKRREKKKSEMFQFLHLALHILAFTSPLTIFERQNIHM